MPGSSPKPPEWLHDPIDDPVADAYGALPDRPYLVGTDGRIVFQGAEGPMGFIPEDLDTAIASVFG